MIPIYRARHDCPCMAIVVVQIAKKIQKSCHAQSSISIAATQHTHNQPQQKPIHSKTILQQKKNSFEVITRLYPFETFPECNYKYILPAENTFFRRTFIFPQSK